ncbi:MAG: 1-acyl-sn-glycerol-3-phosphate acyltransferase [Candidatus Omnitrophica bacterium]|nr:1-acyl-sn-glycerol-3-phosphate acyltransferase [Candidatus Omnitrophota bacterium]MCA9435307.1 1-acyl-sn-glycerol-3-phosphate acyltransferase [Candidatus Omnitrophota bacterium]
MARIGKFLFSLYFWTFFVIDALIMFTLCFLSWLFTFWWDPRVRLLNYVSAFWGASQIYCNPLWRVTIEGREKIDPSIPTLLVSNHQSSFDIYLIYMLYKPFHWVSKKSNFYVPFVGWNMIFMRTIGFDRDSRKDILRMVKDSVKRLEQGISLIIFPEGERTADGRLIPFLGGAFAIAKKAKVRIQPIALSGTYQILPRHQWMLNPFANLKLEVLDPIPLETVEAHSTDELAKITYDLIADRLPPEHLPIQGEPKRAMEPND